MTVFGWISEVVVGMERVEPTVVRMKRQAFAG
jgi:hypothetical protein